MRTTIILDDELGERLRAKAHSEGKSFSAFMADAGRRMLEGSGKSDKEPFQLVTFRGKGVFEGIDLDRSNELIAAEDRETYGV
ncbi:MAG: hypothetical protein JJU20_13320 [Opitutales bacterium]|nr:hypothetical protein [Opitutales bacterium]